MFVLGPLCHYETHSFNATIKNVSGHRERARQPKLRASLVRQPLRQRQLHLPAVLEEAEGRGGANT